MPKGKGSQRGSSTRTVRGGRQADRRAKPVCLDCTKGVGPKRTVPGISVVHGAGKGGDGTTFRVIVETRSRVWCAHRFGGGRWVETKSAKLHAGQGKVSFSRTHTAVSTQIACAWRTGVDSTRS